MSGNAGDRPPEFRNDIAEIKATLSEIRIWLLGNGKEGTFSQVNRMQREIFGDQMSGSRGILQELRDSRDLAEYNKNKIKQLHTLVIIALVGLAVLILMGISDEGFATEFMSKLLKLL